MTNMSTSTAMVCRVPCYSAVVILLLLLSLLLFVCFDRFVWVCVCLCVCVSLSIHSFYDINFVANINFNLIFIASFRFPKSKWNELLVWLTLAPFFGYVARFFFVCRVGGSHVMSCFICFHFVSFRFILFCFIGFLLSLPIHACRMLLFARNIFSRKFCLNISRSTSEFERIVNANISYLLWPFSSPFCRSLFAICRCRCPPAKKDHINFYVVLCIHWKSSFSFSLSIVVWRQSPALALHSTSSRISMCKVSNAVHWLCVCVCLGPFYLCKMYRNT